MAQLGSVAARRWGVKEGDRVALKNTCRADTATIAAAATSACATRPTRSTNQAPGYGSTPISQAPSLWGGYSQHQYLHPNSVFHRAPENLPATLATLALPLGNGVEWGYLQGKVGVGQAIVIQGPGQQGLACVVAAKEAGANPIIVSGLGTPTDQKRLALAKRLGAHHTINVDEQDLDQDSVGHHRAARWPMW